MSEEEVERSFTRDQIRELALEAIHAQRDALLQARDEGIFSSAALEGALARLDNEEILLVSSRGASTESRPRARKPGRTRGGAVRREAGQRRGLSPSSRATRRPDRRSPS